MTTLLEEKLNTWFQPYHDGERVPCMSFSLVNKDKGEIYRKSFNTKFQTLVDHGKDETTFAIASCTKVVTSVAAMQLLEKGIINLDEPVSKYIKSFLDIPGVKEHAKDTTYTPLKRPITIRHIWTHTAGLSYNIISNLTNGKPNPLQQDYFKAMHTAKTLEEMVNNCARLPLVTQPGENWNYSIGIDVLGRIVEVVSGMTIDKYFEQYIFQPLGMNSTYFSQHVPDRHKNRQASIYNCDIPTLMKDPKKFFLPDTTVNKMDIISGDDDIFQAGADTPLNPGGGLISSMSDWSKFVQMFLNNGRSTNGTQIISPESIDLMSKKSTETFYDDSTGPKMAYINGRNSSDQHYDQGLGIATGGNGKYKTFEWGGMTSTVFWVDREKDLGCIAFTQLMPSAIWKIRDELKDIVYDDAILTNMHTIGKL